MSQVKRNIPMMQNGGAAPGQQTQESTPKTYGKFIMNGQEEQVTDDFINQFSNWLSTQDRDVQSSLAGVRKQLQAGETVNFDSHAQELSDNSGLPFKNGRQESRMRRQRTGAGMLFDALTNNQVHRNAVAMDALSSFRYNKPVPEPIKPTEVKFSPYVIDYNTDEQGNKVYSQGPQNMAARQRLNQFVDYLGMDEEGRKGWNFSGFGSGLTLDNLVNSYNENPQAILDAWSRVESNSANQDDEDLLRAFQISLTGEAAGQPATSAQNRQSPDDVIRDYGLDVEQANNYGIGLNEDMSLDLSRLDPNKVYLFSDYSPITKGKYYGGAYYNGNLYTKEEAEQNQELINLLAPYREQVAKGIYNDTASVVHNWGRPVSSETYDPTKEYFAPFHDVLQPINGRNQRYTWLNQGYDVDANDAGEHMISVEDYESGTNPLTGYANKLKYYLYSPQTGITMDYSPIRQLRESADLNQTYAKPSWGPRYKNGQRYAPISDRDGYKFYVGENDGQWYVERGDEGDYYLVQDPEVALRIMRGQGVNEADVTRMLKGANSSTSGTRGQAYGKEHGKVLNTDQGYRFPRGSLKNWTAPNQDTWATYLLDLDQQRGKALGNNADGTPRRYQYGGALRNIAPVKADSAIQRQELDISTRDPRDTKVLGDGRGLSGNDKLELAAMAADLAGLGLSFIPGAGNIAGGVAGVGGTAAQFAADVNRDGLDWGDVGRGALNLGLDALTFIPGLGTAAKAGKVVRNIRRIGTTVLKALAIGGAGNAALTAANKIINGDKWTMDDLRVVVAGLQGGTAVGRSVNAQAKAGRQWKNIQNKNINARNSNITEGGLTTKKATLRGLEETSITKGKGKNKTTTIGTKEVDKSLDLKFSDKDIKTFNRLKGADAKNEFLASKLKTDYNFTPTPEQSKSLMDAFSLPKDKTLSFKGRSVTTQRGKLEGETRTPALTTRQAYKQAGKGYNFRKGTRSTKNAAAQATQPFINRDALVRAGRNPLAGPRSLWEVGQSPWRTLQITRTGEDSNRAVRRYDEWNNQYRSYKQGGLIPKYQSGARMRLEDMNAITNWGDVLSNFGQRTFSQADLDVLNRQHAARLGIGNSRIGANVGTFQTAFNNPLLSGIIGHVASTDGYGQTARGAYNANQNGAYNVDNRLGGVTRSWMAGSEALQKYFGDPNTGNGSNVIFDPTGNNGQGAYTFRNVNDNVALANNDTDPIGFDSGLGSDANPVAIDPVVITASRPSGLGNIPKGTNADANGSGIFRGGFKKLGQLGLNPDNALAIGSLAMALGHNNRQANVMKRGIRQAMNAMESSPFEVYPRFSDFGVNSAYEAAAQQQLGVKPATSDYLMSHAIEQDAKNRADQLRLEGRLKTSELYSNFLNTTDDLRRNYGAMRTDVANRNRQRGAQLNMALAETEAGRLANQYTSWNNFIMEKRDRLAKDKDKFDQYQNMLLRSDLSNDQQNRYKNAITKYQAEFDTATDKLPGESLENWAVRTKPDVANELNTINRDVIQQYGNANLDYYNMNGQKPGLKTLNNLFNIFGTRRFANGGKTTKGKTLNAGEQIWKQQNKDVADAVKQINKNVITLFLKATT